MPANATRGVNPNPIHTSAVGARTARLRLAIAA
jgi:hypothetical protein